MEKSNQRQSTRRSFRQILLEIATLLHGRWRQWRRLHAMTVSTSNNHTAPIIDAHDHAAMLVRWQHWCAWLEAQQLEVEQRIASRATRTDEEEAG